MMREKMDVLHVKQLLVMLTAFWILLKRYEIICLTVKKHKPLKLDVDAFMSSKNDKKLKTKCVWCEQELFLINDNDTIYWIKE